MKKIFTILLAALALININLAAQTFTSIGDGNLNDPTIWSTDGGITNCNCTPISEFGGLFAINKGSMEINHDIRSNTRTTVLGSGIIVDINLDGSLSVADEFEVRSGVVNNYGILTANKVTIYNSGYLHSMGILEIEPGDLVNAFQGRLEIFGQVFVRQGSIYNEGWITLRTGSQVVAAGDLTNDAFIDFEPGACMNLYGEVQNNFEMDLINGPGFAYVQSGSNITNDSLWNTAINYCAPGTVTGLSHAPNCSGCGTLPVELVDFNATMENEQTLLT